MSFFCFLFSRSFFYNGIFVENPVVLIVVFEGHLSEQVLKQVAQVLVVRLLFKRKASTVVHVLFKLDWAGFAELIHGHFLLSFQHFSFPIIN